MLILPMACVDHKTPSQHVGPSSEMSPFPVATLVAPVNVDIN